MTLWSLKKITSWDTWAYEAEVGDFVAISWLGIGVVTDVSIAPVETVTRVVRVLTKEGHTELHASTPVTIFRFYQ